uniref:Uncharacterized protein n=1 Tax=Anguilla anguilla TaxID=7936 RepID=A0A0E9UMX0_ANGAN
MTSLLMQELWFKSLMNAENSKIKK